MELTTETVGDVLVVAITREHFDASNSDHIGQTMRALFSQGTKLVLDLARVRFVDSTGLGAIFACMKALDALGGTLKLCGLTQRVEVLFDLVRMNKLVDVFPTRQEAIHSFTQPSGA